MRARRATRSTAIAPQGAIYLSVRFDLRAGARRRAIATNEDIRKLLLEHAGLAVVPFQAFGLQEDSGWFRLSVGAVSLEEIEQVFPRVEQVLSRPDRSRRRAGRRSPRR